MAFHLVTDGAPTERASIPYATDLDGYTSGFFLMARVEAADLAGFGDEQTIVSMWRGPATTSLTFYWFLHTDGTFRIHFFEVAGTEYDNASGVVTTDQTVVDGDTFWVGVSVRFSSGALTQWYWGGTGASPNWETWGAESSVTAGVLNMRSDASNTLTLGDSRYNTGPADEWNGKIYEYRQFNDAFGLGTRVAYFNAADFSVGDGNTDTAVGAEGNTWTLAGSASMIADDSEAEGGAKVTIDTYDTPHQPESIGHSEKYSLWRWFSGIATARTVIITGGVATPSPGAVHPTVTQLDDADDSTTTAGGKAIWYSTGSDQVVSTAEGIILATAGYTVT